MDYFGQIQALFTFIDQAPISGERRLQKIAFLVDLPFRFELKETGPYSFELKAMVEKLLDSDMITLNVKIYMITSSGRYFWDRLSKDGYRFDLKEDVNLLSCFTPNKLEAMATVKYLKEIGYSEETAKEKITVLRPNLKVVL